MNRGIGRICRGWHRRVWVGIGGLALALLLLGPAKAQNFETALASAADGIAQAIEQTGSQRVAVIDFDQIEGPVTALGRFLAEEISANLAERPRAFAVIDRANLQSILAENALSMSGLVNPENAKRLGLIAGVDALIFGTYTDFGETYRLSLKAIATDTAEMVASARTNLPKTKALEDLDRRPIDPRELTPRAPHVAGGPSPPTVSPLPSEVTTSNVLYETGKGDFEGWSLSPDWKRLNGMLVNDGSSDSSRIYAVAPVLAPYEGGPADYAVEAEIKVIQNEGGYRDSFGVVVRSNGQEGYAAGIKGNIPSTTRDDSATMICYLGDRARNCRSEGNAFDYGTDWHTYRVEVKGNSITLVIDNQVMARLVDNRFLSAGSVGLWSNAFQLEIRNFKVISLQQHAAASPENRAARAVDLAGGGHRDAVETIAEARVAPPIRPAAAARERDDARLGTAAELKSAVTRVARELERGERTREDGLGRSADAETERDRLCGRLLVIEKERERLTRTLTEMGKKVTQVDALEAQLQEAQLLHTRTAEALITEATLSREALNQVEILNRRINALRVQLAALDQALEVERQKVEDQQITIADLGRKLHLALASTVEELTRLRSQFFGRLRQVLGDREDIRVVGDRFVFQSEVLFPTAAVQIEPSGRDELQKLAETIKPGFPG